MFKPIIIASLALFIACSKAKPSAAPMPELRLTPAELRELPVASTTIGTSGMAGIRTKVVFGDPSRRGLYSILLMVPPGTTIKPHSHRDDRVATVLTGTWRFGFGDTFNAAALKALPPGSVYTEPGNGQNHFAQTTSEPVIVHITGFGPTDTKYVNDADAPPMQK